MKNKKAQGLPMNTIVIAALVLVVMIVLILIFTGNIGGWREDVEKTETSAMARAKCIGKGGTVKENCDYNTEEPITIDDLGTNLKCCITKKTCSQQGGGWTFPDPDEGTCPDNGIEITDTSDKPLVSNQICCK